MHIDTFLSILLSVQCSMFYWQIFIGLHKFLALQQKCIVNVEGWLITPLCIEESSSFLTSQLVDSFGIGYEGCVSAMFMYWLCCWLFFYKLWKIAEQVKIFHMLIVMTCTRHVTNCWMLMYNGFYLSFRSNTYFLTKRVPWRAMSCNLRSVL